MAPKRRAKVSPPAPTREAVASAFQALLHLAAAWDTATVVNPDSAGGVMADIVALARAAKQRTLERVRSGKTPVSSVDIRKLRAFSTLELAVTELVREVRSDRLSATAVRARVDALVAANNLVLAEQAYLAWEKSLGKLRGKSTPSALGRQLAAKATGMSPRQADYLAKASEDAFIAVLLDCDPLTIPAAADYALRALHVGEGVRKRAVEQIARDVQPDYRIVSPRPKSPKGKAARHQHPSVLYMETKRHR